jgi:hypothetical protein
VDSSTQTRQAPSETSDRMPWNFGSMYLLTKSSRRAESRWVASHWIVFRRIVPPSVFAIATTFLTTSSLSFGVQSKTLFSS